MDEGPWTQGLEQSGGILWMLKREFCFSHSIDEATQGSGLVFFY